ncbi:hypothetical protein H4CHR_02907 [Variovorax sp. PBS-H4]|nr:hypothetical protein H4CHR_02907 [Variovorax sp. PBS-H4]
MPHNQGVRDALFQAILNGPVRHTASQASELARRLIDILEQELEDARMLRWILSVARISWQDGNHTHAQICFPVQADMFDTLEEQLRRARGDSPEDND